MSHQLSPRQVAVQEALDATRDQLPNDIQGLIVGGALSGHNGLYLRLNYRRNDFGAPVGYWARLEEIKCGEDNVPECRYTESIPVKSVERFIPDQLNKMGIPGAVCLLPDPKAIADAAGQLRHYEFGEWFRA